MAPYHLINLIHMEVFGAIFFMCLCSLLMAEHYRQVGSKVHGPLTFLSPQTLAKHFEHLTISCILFTIYISIMQISSLFEQRKATLIHVLTCHLTPHFPSVDHRRKPGLSASVPLGCDISRYHRISVRQWSIEEFV